MEQFNRREPKKKPAVGQTGAIACGQSHPFPKLPSLRSLCFVVGQRLFLGLSKGLQNACQKYMQIFADLLLPSVPLSVKPVPDES
jgi:hypothetical protein